MNIIINIMLGTAFLIAPNTYVTTGHQVKMDVPYDVIVRELPSKHATPLDIDCREMIEGEHVFTMGYPWVGGGELKTSIGRVVSSSEHTFTTNMPLTKGFSGSPVFDADGEVVGVVTRKHTHGSQITSICEVL
jgi:V8-like Glu-specific endopeptidase